MIRPQKRLSFDEREHISRSLAAGNSGAEIARQLGRDPSVVNREIRRGGGREAYRALNAQKSALRRGQSSNKVASNPRLEERVIELLRVRTPPREIADRLRREYPEDPTMNASAETIYDYIYCHTKPELRKWLISKLKNSKSKRGGRTRKTVAASGRLPGYVSISERPKDVDLRAVPGDWEADLIVSAKSSAALLVAVERTTRFTLIRKVPSKHASVVGAALRKLFRDLPAHLRRTLTYDNGKEMALHAQFTVATNVRVYFADPHSPWQRGAVEQTNGLIREYFPKPTDFNNVSHQAIANVQAMLNSRPRRVLAAATPAEVFRPLINTGCAVAA
jgi:transposase, IS30 family